MLLEVIDALGPVILLKEVCHLAWPLHAYSLIPFNVHYFSLLNVCGNMFYHLLPLDAYCLFLCTFPLWQ